MNRYNLRKRKENPAGTDCSTKYKRQKTVDAPPVRTLRRLRKKSNSKQIIQISDDSSTEVQSTDLLSERSSTESLFVHTDNIASIDQSEDSEFLPSAHMFSATIDEVVKNSDKSGPDSLKVAEEEAIRVQKLIDDDEPNIFKILNTPMGADERKRLVMLYEVYKNSPDYTLEYIELRDQIVESLDKHSKISLEDQQRVESESKRLLAVAPPNDEYALKKRIIDLNTTDIVKSRLLQMYKDLSERSTSTDGYAELKRKLEWSVSLPYNNVSTVNLNSPEEINAYCVKIRRELDAALYGLDDVKDTLINTIVNRITNPKTKSTIALEGPAGVGKTAIFSALARAIGLPFERVALGGMTDSSILKGSDSVWVGSEPSIILRFLKNMKIANGIVLFDEIDKLGDTPEGQRVQHALLHITDYTQNNEFMDVFLNEYPHDLSQIWFVYALNDRTRINPILRDRLTILEISPYNHNELTKIISGYVLPRALDSVGINRADCAIDKHGCDKILSYTSIGRNIGRDVGVRAVEKCVESIVSRINYLRSVTLPDGTTGELKVKYKIPNFKLPLLITSEIVERLVTKPKNTCPSYIS